MAESSSDAGTSTPALPQAEFIEDVAAFMSGKSIDPVIQSLNDDHRKYKLLESQVMQRKARLMGKLPEIQKALDIVNKLVENSSGDETVIDFELAESVYAKTRVKGAASVNLWLGADVMVEYPLEEAQQLLQQNLANCKASLKNHESDLEVLKDNITTVEVSISRVWNYDVERRRKEKEQGGSAA